MCFFLVEILLYIVASSFPCSVLAALSIYSGLPESPEPRNSVLEETFLGISSMVSQQKLLPLLAQATCQVSLQSNPGSELGLNQGDGKDRSGF